MIYKIFDKIFKKMLGKTFFGYTIVKEVTYQSIFENWQKSQDKIMELEEKIAQYEDLCESYEKILEDCEVSD